MFPSHIVMSVTPRTQFSGQTVNKCIELARTLGKAGTFHRVSLDNYDWEKSVNERIGKDGIDFVSKDLSRMSTIDLSRSAYPRAELEFNFAPKPVHLLWNPPFLLYTVLEDYVSNDPDGQILKALIEVFKHWIVELKAYYGHAYIRHYDRIGDWPASRPLGSAIPIYDLIHSISWATYFGPELVQYLKEEKLLSAPVHKIEALDTGGILIFLCPKPLDPENPEIHDVQKRTMDHLGLKLLDKHIVRDILRERLKGLR
jgi:hypothetical protein